MTEVADNSPLDETKGLIYHYTTQNGLLGILEKKQIWATHLRYLNDLEEYKTGVALLKRLSKEAQDNGLIAESVVEDVENLLDIIKSFDFYAASFSQAGSGDSLNLWRAYANSIPGYSIGIDAEKLRRIIRPTKQSPGMRWLSKVHYMANSQAIDELTARWSSRIFLSILKELDNSGLEKRVVGKRSVAEWVPILVKSLDVHKKAGMLIASILPTLKDISFSDEVESRVIVIGHPDMPSNEVLRPEFRPGGWSIVPHMNVPISLGPDHAPIVERIVVGPCPHPSEARRAVQILLASKGISNVEVDSSQIPYRNW